MDDNYTEAPEPAPVVETPGDRLALMFASIVMVVLLMAACCSVAGYVLRTWR